MSVSGTEPEFVEFVEYRSAALLRTAYLLCGGDRPAAEDLLQDTLERCYLRWSRINGAPEPYVRAALANAAANRWRWRARRKVELPLVSPPHVDAPEQAVVDRDLLVRALATLPPRMRAVLVLRYFEDLSEAQTAAALGCMAGTVKSQTFKGLAKLRELLGEQDRVAPVLEERRSWTLNS